jgi:hypothetical protein
LRYRLDGGNITSLVRPAGGGYAGRMPIVLYHMDTYVGKDSNAFWQRP